MAPSWICWAPTGTTHDDQLVVSIVTPNLVKSMQYSFDNGFFAASGCTSSCYFTKIQNLNSFSNLYIAV